MGGTTSADSKRCIGIANRLLATLIIKAEELACLLIPTLTGVRHVHRVLAHYILVSSAASQAAAPASRSVVGQRKENPTGVTGPSLPEGSRVQRQLGLYPRHFIFCTASNSRQHTKDRTRLGLTVTGCLQPVEAHNKLASPPVRKRPS